MGLCRDKAADPKHHLSTLGGEEKPAARTGPVLLSSQPSHCRHRALQEPHISFFHGADEQEIFLVGPSQGCRTPSEFVKPSVLACFGSALLNLVTFAVPAHQSPWVGVTRLGSNTSPFPMSSSTWSPVGCKEEQSKALSSPCWTLHHPISCLRAKSPSYSPLRIACCWCPCFNWVC